MSSIVGKISKFQIIPFRLWAQLLEIIEVPVVRFGSMQKQVNFIVIVNRDSSFSDFYYDQSKNDRWTVYFWRRCFHDSFGLRSILMMSRSSSIPEEYGFSRASFIVLVSIALILSSVYVSCLVFLAFVRGIWPIRPSLWPPLSYLCPRLFCCI